MITSKYLGAAGVAVFMLGVAAGYTLGGTEPAPEAARFRVRAVAPQIGAINQRATFVASDTVAPALAWLRLVAE
jgi:hypothetical protein